MIARGASAQTTVKAPATASASARQSPVVFLMPAISPFPQYCAVNTLAPEQTPKRIMFRRKNTWVPKPTAAISVVPSLPIMTVPIIFTNELARFWSMIGMAIVKRDEKNILSEKSEVPFIGFPPLPRSQE